jgi:hypothetical protein
MKLITQCLPKSIVYEMKFYGKEHAVVLIPKNEDYSDCKALVMTKYL